ncbi:hypothetical protein CAL29_01940 [Bordetella genomosp. 10]|uniref:ABC transmembrane type-1 domain-containing protein n=1 Tax=Bordetella genomosp. 10 TaxID=1416804 RepID=A0A261SLM6_9BORD|nr:ABC transporter permease [Bordetella genomosp. 10]OZI37213.1 hypothetical protein CAL29_01940 [Bordetella genomosp. 10]
MTVVTVPYEATRTPRVKRPVVGGALLLPAVAFLTAFLVLPSLVLLAYSFMTPQTGGGMGFPLHLSSYMRLLTEPTYQQVILRTLRIALITSVATAVLAYPLAIVIAHGNPKFSRLVIVLVVMPLLVSVLVRTYGWQILLGNNRTGAINWLLADMGLKSIVIKLLYSETAVIIASVHVFLPLMVLPIAGSLARIDPSITQAARMLGASSWGAFRLITFPLTFPGLAAGLGIVFSLTAASYITPAMIGGRTGAMLGNLLEQQMTTVYDWSMGGAIAVVMVLISVTVNLAINRLVDRRVNAMNAGNGRNK